MQTTDQRPLTKHIFKTSKGENLYYEKTPKNLKMCNLTGKPLQDNVLGYIEDIILNIKDQVKPSLYILYYYLFLLPI